MLKKILITIIAVLTMISNANAVVIMSKTKIVEVSRTNNSAIIGKDYHGCKVVDAFYSSDMNKYTIICLKDRRLYRDSYPVKRIETKCDGWKCEDYSKDIPALFEENVNK